VVFEAAQVGGTCLNEGCIPTKSFARNAEIVQTLKEAATFGLDNLKYDFHFDRVVERKNEVLTALRSGIETLLSHPNITLVREKGVFADAHTVGDYTADNIIIATGSETKWLPIKGCDDPRVVDSTGLLQLETLPKRLAIIGAGVIGMEFASVFNRFGSEVTVIEYLKECLPALDSDIAKRLRKYLEKQGITFKMKTAVENIADIDADVILMATGRKPRVQADFANAGIEYDERKGVTVDENFKTTVNGIYAIGDVNGRQMLAHAAEMQAIRAVNHIIGKKDAIDFNIMPAAIFTQPEAACVGPTEDQLKEQGIAYECKKSFWRANGKAMAMNETEGMLKLFVSPDGLILGCHAYGAHSADIVQEVSVLMCKHTTIAELADMVHIHPTLSEILKNAVE
jgi:dihydrolipoamide dehydrogenase